jgi:hypothetical protein
LVSRFGAADLGEEGGGMMRRSVTVRLGAFAADAVSGKEGGGSHPEPDDVLRAISFYLSDRDGGRTGWRYPEFLRGTGLGGKIDVELSIENSLWRSLKREAESQGVSVEQLVEHAALYYAAEFDAGHITERMLGESGKG